MVALDVGGAIKGQHFDIYQASARMRRIWRASTIMAASGAESRAGNRPAAVQ